MTLFLALSGYSWLTMPEPARAARRLALAAVLAGVVPEPGRAQDVVEIQDRVSCPDCVIEVGPPVTLALPSDRFSFTSFPGSTVARDSRGHYIAAPVEGEALVAVFGPDGRFMSSYGRIGAGPGEFATDAPLLVEVGDGDVLYAIDLLNLHTLAPKAESSLHQVRMPVPATDAVVLAGGRVAVQATVRTEAGNTTIQILRPDGTIETSIGAVQGGTGSEPPGMERRVLGRSKDRADLWSAHVSRYRVTRLGADGEEKARIERLAEWFRPYSRGTPGAPYRAPADPRVVGVHQDADGLLWVAVRRAPPSFSSVSDAPARVEVPLSAYLDLNQFLHTTVEVLDPVAGELIASRYFAEYVEFVSTPGGDVFISSLHPDALGGLDCVVRSLKLRRE